MEETECLGWVGCESMLMKMMIANDYQVTDDKVCVKEKPESSRSKKVCRMVEILNIIRRLAIKNIVDILIKFIYSQ